MVTKTFAEHQTLLDVVMGRKPPSRVIRGGQVLNVHTGRLEKKDIALAGRWIAYVGSLEESGLLFDESVAVDDANGRVLVPGYIEPHAHPCQIYHPLSLASKAVQHGTTALVCDTLPFFMQLETIELLTLFDELQSSPVKFFWWGRLDSQTLLNEDEAMTIFAKERVQSILNSPHVVQAGELSDWMPLLLGDKKMNACLLHARAQGKRIEGHAPGASYRTLSRLAALGVTGDHESITAQEIWRRLELGYMTTLRHSSIRPDLPELLQGLLQYDDVPWHRLMMTTDGATPAFLAQGFTDHLLRLALEQGVDPIHAYQMVTINPATYYRLDEHIGSIAPGRLADINLLSSLVEPTPLGVLNEGEWIRPATQAPTLPVKAQAWGGTFQIAPDELIVAQTEEGTVPVINLVNAVITKLSLEPVPLSRDFRLLPDEDDRLAVFMIDRHGTWITGAYVRGFGRRIDAFASSYTCTHDLLLIGRDARAMAKAANHVLERNGGIYWLQDGEVRFELPLPILGTMSDLTVDELIPLCQGLVERLNEAGYTFLDPIYTLQFLSSTHLPQVRLTSAGVVNVKKKNVITPRCERKG
ncbi:adenine deaminase C-terminal domain-containing protein [Laceyella putida]|uniref:adenine deaminase n=1 Tax=Laceyella putida TaxID=110101 RepID=A0ABW2RII1_9BACL